MLKMLFHCRKIVFHGACLSFRDRVDVQLYSCYCHAVFMKHIKEVILPDAAFILHSYIYIRVFIFYSPASGSCHCHIDYLCIKTVVSYLIHYIIMHLAFYICRTQTVYSVKFFIFHKLPFQIFALLQCFKLL